MEPNEKKEKWLDQATGAIPFGPDRAEVRQELAATWRTRRPTCGAFSPT